MTTTASLRIAALAVCLGLASPAGDGDAPATSAGVSSLVRLLYAEVKDADRSGDASRGDVVVLGLRRPLAPKRVVTLDDLPLAGTHARWGDGAVLTAVPGESEIRIVLGEGASLVLADSYRPGRHGATPAQLRTATGAVPILMEASARRWFAGERHPDAAVLVPFYGQLHAHTGFSDGDLTPAEAYASARREGLDFLAVTDHLEQLTPESWTATREMARAADQPGTFAALYGYEWGGYPSLHGWMNHVNVLGSDERLGVWSTIGLGRLYERLAALPGRRVVASFNHPGMNHRLGRNDWDGFAYDAQGDRRVRLVHVETTSDAGEDNRETAGYVPALDRGWHVAPKGEEDNHTANWGRSRRRTGLWLDRLDAESVLAGLERMATFYTDDRDASLKLVADREWLMGSTVYGDGPHRLEADIRHRTRVAHVTSVELVSVGGAVVARQEGGQTPLTVAWDVDPATDAYYFVRVVLESADARMISAPVFVDR